MIWVAYMSSSNVFEDMSLPCLLNIYALIGLVLYCTYINDKHMIKGFLHLEHSHLFLTRSFNFNSFDRANTLFASCELRACVATSRMGGDKI